MSFGMLGESVSLDGLLIHVRVRMSETAGKTQVRSDKVRDR